MRKSNCKGMPDVDNKEENDEFVRYVGRQLSLVRASIKEKVRFLHSCDSCSRLHKIISSSKSEDDEDRNVAAIANAILASMDYSFKPTLAFYMRIALIV